MFGAFYFRFMLNVLLSQYEYDLVWSYVFLKREVFMQHMLRMGIDVGSTTVKVVLLDEHDNYLYKKYIRHYANILDTVYTLLQEAQVGHENDQVHVCITGSGGMAMAEKVRIPFVQEVIAETRAVKEL